MDFHHIFLVFVLLLATCTPSKLNVPRVLLSYNYEVPSNFTLKVIEGGCYDWRSTRGGEVVVRPVQGAGGDCSTEAVVSAVTRSPARQTAIILATDNASGVTLRCDVIIDSISRLEIVTTTRELYVEEAPEEFEVRAYDDLGNEFSSLNGLKFEWQLEDVAGQQGAVPAHTVLRFIRFSDSPYESSNNIRALEQRGEQGSRVLIEGRQTGLGRLKAAIPHPSYQSLPPSAVTLMVIANLLLEPQDVYVLPDTAVPYTVLHLKHGLLHPVPLRPSHYYLQVADTDVAELQSDGITVLSHVLGQTKVMLFDRNVEAATNIKQPTANYHVVEPGYLSIEIDPGNKPSLIVDRPAAFHVQVFDKQNNKVFLSDNIAINTVVPREYFLSLETRPNGTFVWGRPRKEGRMTVTATLSQFTVNREVVTLGPPLVASVDVTIYGPLTVTPKLTVLPWDPVTQPEHIVLLTASGGSGHVLWRSNATDVATVASGGQATTVALGTATITAAMAQNSDNSDTADIWVREVVGLTLLPGWREAAVGEALELGLAAFTAANTSDEAAERTVFTACHMLPYAVSKLSSDFVSLPEVRPGLVEEGSCATLDVIGQQPGFSSVQAEYTLHSGTQLTVSTTVGAYLPLEVVTPSSGTVVLASGTGSLVVFEGGPLPWVHKPSGHFAQLKVDEPSVVIGTLLQDGNTTARYQVFAECQQLGEAVLTLTVGNHPSSTLPRPRHSVATARVVCGVPEALQIFVLPPVADRCPLHHNTGVASCHGPVPLAVTLTDAEGRRLANVSSLLFSWTASSSGGLVTLPEDGPLQRGITDPPADYGMLQPHGDPGELSVTVQLPSAGLSSTLLLRLVPNPALEPPQLVLWHQPGSSGHLTITGGSGYFELDEAVSPKTEEAVARAKHIPSNSSVLVTAIADGTRSVNVRDLCLTVAPAAVATVRVASLGAVTLSVPPLVQRDGQVQALLQLLDPVGLPLPVQPALMKVVVTTQDDIVSVAASGLSEAGEAVFLVKGLQLGDTILRASVASLIQRPDGAKQPTIFSTPQPVQVYPPLRLRPRVITLMVGAVYQVEASGGPEPASGLHYYGSNSSVCSVAADSGVITAAALGNSTVKARALVTLPAGKGEGRRTVVLESEDEVLVRVVPLSGFELVAPTRHLQSGTSMPVHVAGRAPLAPGHTVAELLPPLGYASADPPLLITWTSSDKQVATIARPLDALHVSGGSVNDAVVRVVARRPGHTTLTATVAVQRPANSPATAQILDGAQLTAKIKIEVFEALSLQSPQSADARLLLSPGAEYQLNTNRDTESRLSYTLEAGCSPSYVASVSSGGLVRANATGQATVLVAATEQSGVTQRAAMLVEVREIRYMQTTVSSALSVSGGGSLTGVPLGTMLPLLITFHDHTGRPFDAVGAADTTATLANRRDLVQVTTSSNSSSLVMATPRAAGQTVLELQHRPLLATDTLRHYLRIPSQPAITPHKACVAVGQPVCLSSMVRGAAGEEGRWGGDRPVLAVAEATGEAVGLQPGRAVVTYTLAAEQALVLQGELLVMPVTEVSLSAPDAVLTDGNVGDEVQVPVSVSAACPEDALPTTPCHPSSLPSTAFLRSLQCTVVLLSPAQGEISEVLATSARYSPEAGYSCAVRVVQQHVPWVTREYHRHAGLSVELRVAVTAAGTVVRSHPLPLSLVPGVRLNSSSEVTLSNLVPVEDRLAVTGPLQALHHLLVNSNSSTVEAVLGSVVSTEGGVSQRVLQVAALEEAWGGAAGALSTVIVTITSPITRQTLPVVVSLQQVGDGSCSSPRRPPASLTPWQLLLSVLSRYHTHFFTVLCVALTAASLAVGYQALCGPGYRHTQQPVFAGSKAAPAPASPTPASPVSPRNLNNISLWSSDSVYGAPHSPPPLSRLSPRKL